MNKARVVLIAESDKKRAAIAAFLSGFGLAVDTRSTLAGAAASLGTGDGLFAMIISLREGKDRVPAALKEWKRARPGLPVIALVPPSAAPAFIKALEDGTVDHLADPSNPATLYSAIRNEELRGRTIRGAATAREDFRRLKRELALHLRRSRALEEAHETTLENFMAALDLRDVETYGHSKTVARYSHVLAEAIGIRNPRTLEHIRKGALLHDSGKMAIPDSILKKAGPLTSKEWDVIRRHPALGYGLVRDVKLVPEVGNIILCHHEKFDGTGYPKGLGGEKIPLEARIFAVADTLDAVTSHRPYRAPRDFRAARRELVGNAGGQFDPKVVDVFCGMDLAVWEKIRFETTRFLPPIEDYRPAAGDTNRQG
jgi:putative nucleotidyltransferase with HDIG domain